jgi:hypothetical protein
MGLGVVLAVAFLAAAISLLPWRVGIAVEAQGDPSGAWALAGGAELFSCSASVARARGAPAVLELRAFGRRLVRRVLPPSSEPSGKRSALYRRLARRIDPFDLLFFLVAETERLSVRDLEGSVHLGLRDVALAGQIAGLLAVASALAGPFGRLGHSIDWSGREHLDASVSLSLRFSPALLFWDTVRFAARAVRPRRRPLGPPAPRPEGPDHG